MDTSEHDVAAPETASTVGDVPEVPLEKWQALDGLWKAILVLEANIESSRLGMNGLRMEMETAFKQVLAVEEKLHASQADVAAWTRAKNRLPLRPAEGEGVHPPGHLGAGRRRAEAVGGDRQDTRRAAGDVPRRGQVAGGTGTPAESPSGVVRPGERGTAGVPEPHRGVPAVPEHASSNRRRQRPQEEGRQAEVRAAPPRSLELPEPEAAKPFHPASTDDYLTDWTDRGQTVTIAL